MRFFLSLFSLFLFFNSFTISAQNAEISITFTGIKTAKGQVLVELKNAKGEVVGGYFVPVSQAGKLVFTVKNIKPGKYAISAFHDKNSDEKLNTNMFGLPTEVYGFSNDARGMFGPPDLEEQLFTVAGDTKISIALK